MNKVTKRVLWNDCLIERILNLMCWNETLSGVLPYAISCDVVLRIYNMIRSNSLALCVLF